jgi:hypothetical protein
LVKGLTSDAVLAVLHPQLEALGFQVEKGKVREQKIERPVFFGENGIPALRYQIDAYHPGWRCGLEVEAGRAWMGNAIHRDLIQALVMVQVDHMDVCRVRPRAHISSLPPRFAGMGLFLIASIVSFSYSIRAMRNAPRIEN